MEYPKLRMYIDGQWVDGGKDGEDVINPATGKVLGRLPHATTADLDRALRVAVPGEATPAGDAAEPDHFRENRGGTPGESPRA